MHRFDARAYYLGVNRLVQRLHREFPFDVIHAHFSYPDGVVGARLARRFHVPLLITEHAPWRPWMDEYPSVRRQALWAFHESVFHLPVSRYVLNTVTHFTGESEKFRVVPVGVNGLVFTPRAERNRRDPNQILFVGRIHHVKGVDILLRAMQRLSACRPKSKLVLVGGGFLFRNYRREDKRLRDMSSQLDLDGHVQFVGPKEPHEVAQLMRNSSVVVLPSRAETFGAVLIEALACGTPVVATRCGGPEEIVTDKLGVLVPSEDPIALSLALQQVLENRESYNPRILREHAINNYSWDKIAQQTMELYQHAVENPNHHQISDRIA